MRIINLYKITYGNDDGDKIIKIIICTKCTYVHSFCMKNLHIVSPK